MPNVQVISNEDALRIEAERRMATLERMQTKVSAPPPSQDDIDPNDAIVGGASGLAANTNDVSAFQRGQGANTPMFLPSSLTEESTSTQLSSSSTYSADIHLHTVASALEADGCLLDIDHAGTPTAGHYCVRPGTKKENCSYVIHVVSETPSLGNASELLGNFSSRAEYAVGVPSAILFR